MRRAIPQRTVALLGGAANGEQLAGTPGPLFALWTHLASVLRADVLYHLTDCGGWWAYVPERFVIVGPPC